MIGEALALFSAFAFALGSVAIAKAMTKGSGESGVLLAVLITGILSAIAWGVVSSSAATSAAMHPASLAWFAASGVLATVWGRLALFKSIHHAGVIRATPTRRLIPFFSVAAAWAILGESIGETAAIGMALVAASFALLLWDARGRIERDVPAGSDRNVGMGYVFGVVGAASYALSFVARKMGLDISPDPYLGALIGSFAALLYYAVGSVVGARYRAAFSQLRRWPEPWQFVAALCISTGQISQFVALSFTGVSQVAVVNSVEVFISAYLAVVVFRTESMPGPLVLAGTLLATAGVVLVAIG